jgi:ketosteroid isomerase-like protein
MARNRSLALALASGLVVLGCGPARADTTPQDEVIAVEHGLADATSADQLAPYYAQDVVVYDMVSPGELHGWQAVHDNLAAQFARVRHPKTEILGLTVVADATLAYAYSTQRYSFEVPGSGQRMQLVFRQTDGLKKIEGQWLVAHQQLSVPYDQKTGMAVLAPPEK